MELQGTLAYVADGAAGLRIVDVSDPSAPTEIGFLDTPGSAFDLELTGAIAWLADGPAGLRAIDVSTPSAPLEIGALDTAGTASELEIRGNLAILADSGSGVRLIDVSVPEEPAEIGALSIAAADVELANGVLYVAAEDDTVRIVDLGPEYVPEPGRILLGIAAFATVASLARVGRTRVR